MWLYIFGLLVVFSLYFGTKHLLVLLWPFIPTSKATKRANPIFNRDLIRNPPVRQEVEFDTTKRNAVLKNSFKIEKVPKDLDVIVIGSGLGGLTAAGILARAGKKVLVLEQHDQAGGCCHVYEEKGFEFDVGIHYVGKMHEGSYMRLLSDQLTDNKLRWELLDEVYDVLALGKNYETRFPFCAGRGVLMDTLIKKYPKEEAGIREVFKAAKLSGKASAGVGLLKVLPKPLSRCLISSGLLKKMFPGIVYVKKSVSEVLNENLVDDELKAILAYSFGDYGVPPTQAPFFMQALLNNHFAEGAYYPRGGASEIAYHMIPGIERAGGRVLVRVKVTGILMNDDQTCVTGVQVRKGSNEFNLFAPMVISDAGIINTYTKLLPPEVYPKLGVDQLMKKVKPGQGLFSVFVGLNGTAKELGIKPQNIWAFRSPKIETVLDDYLALSADEARVSDAPLIFLSFPSAKDPTFNIRYPGKTTCAIITVTPYKWFSDWKDGKVNHRGQDYHDLKMDIGRRMWQQVLEMYPHLEDKLEYLEVGTPLSNQYYLNSTEGEVYGLDHDLNRFDLNVGLELRPDTPISGLYLTGQDVYSCGYSGAMAGGLLCVSSIMKRNLMLEVEGLVKLWKKENNSKKN